MPIDPVQFLKDAIAAVPAVRYALGVGGTAAVVSIALAGFGLDAKTAVFGTLIMFVLMVVLVVFSKLAQTGSRSLYILALVLAWAFTFLAISSTVLFASSFFFDYPKPMPCLLDPSKCGGITGTTATNSVRDLMQKILVLRGTYETIKDYGAIAENAVRQDAAPLAEQLANIADAQLNLSHQIAKYEYAAYGYALAASVETNNLQRRKYAGQVLALGKRAIALMEKAKDLAAHADPEGQTAFTWISGNKDVDRTRYLMAIAFAIDARSGGSTSMNEVREGLNAISPGYLQDFPPETHPDLAWAKSQP